MGAMSRCRTCRSTNLQRVIDLGNHPPANAFLTAAQVGGEHPSYPLDVLVCLDCALIQIANYITPEYYKHYVYVPSGSAAMHAHFGDLAATIARRFFAGGGTGLAVDIGANEGLLLQKLHGAGVRVVGVEPAANLTEVARAKGLTMVNECFTPATADAVRAEHGRARVIVTTNTFNSVDDLHTFMDGVLALLDTDGVLVIEVPHALELVRKTEFDTVYQEHLSQFSLTSLAALFGDFGMHVCDVEPLAVHGGSLRVFAGRRHLPQVTSAAGVFAAERQAGLFDPATYEAFRARVERNKAATLDLLGDLKRRGRRIAGYGAPAKGNTLLNYYGVGPDTLDWLADRNPLKHGLYSPGRHIPVVPVDRILQERPDDLLILAWNFADEVMREQRAYQEAGGRFIVPIPEPRIVAAADAASQPARRRAA